MIPFSHISDNIILFIELCAFWKLIYIDYTIDFTRRFDQ